MGGRREDGGVAVSGTGTRVEPWRGRVSMVLVLLVPLVFVLEGGERKEEEVVVVSWAEKFPTLRARRRRWLRCGGGGLDLERSKGEHERSFCFGFGFCGLRSGVIGRRAGWRSAVMVSGGDHVLFRNAGWSDNEGGFWLAWMEMTACLNEKSVVFRRGLFSGIVGWLSAISGMGVDRERMCGLLSGLWRVAGGSKSIGISADSDPEFLCIGGCESMLSLALSHSGVVGSDLTPSSRLGLSEPTIAGIL